MRKLSMLLLSLLVAGSATAQEELLNPAAGKSFTIAVVQDGPGSDADVVEQIQIELAALLGDVTEVRYRTADAFDAGWSAARAELAIRAALTDPQVDLVLAAGPLVTQAANAADLTKPVVSTFVQRTDLFGVVELQGDRSTKPNLSVTLIPLRAEADLIAFFELVSFDTIHLVVDERIASQISTVRNAADDIARALGVGVELLTVTDGFETSLAAAGDEIQAVALHATPRLTEQRRAELIQALNRRRIPTFSILGYRDVELGALASRTPDFSGYLARRVALSLGELMRGTPADQLPVLLPVDAKLLLNARTAAEIGYSPAGDVLLLAEFLHPEELRVRDEPLTMSEAFEIAQSNNLDLAISDQDVEIAFRDRQLAKATFLPQIGLTPNYTNIRLRGLESLIPEETAGVGVTLQQMIWDDELVSNFKSADQLSEGSRDEREAERMGVLARAGRAFFELGQARALYRVDLSNLELTEENLELSRFREQVGYSGRDEVFRWESEVAKRKSQLFEREADVEAGRIALNQILGIEQDRRWAPEETEVEEGVWPFVDGRLTENALTVAGSARLLETMIEVARENSPELRAIQKSVQAQEIQLAQSKRRWYLPKFGIDATYDYDAYQSPELSGVGNDFWSFRVLARYPVSEGGARAQQIKQNNAETMRLEREQDLTRDLVERATRTSWRRMEGSFYALRYARAAAESARKNLSIVQDKYALGLVNVTDLLEAQTESFSADQTVVISTYSFLIDLIAFQRAISWFEDEKTEAEKDAFVERVQSGLAPGATR